MSFNVTMFASQMLDLFEKNQNINWIRLKSSMYLWSVMCTQAATYFTLYCSWAKLLISNRENGFPCLKAIPCPGSVRWKVHTSQGLSLQHENHTLVATGFFMKDTAIVTPLSSTHLVCSWVIYSQCRAFWSKLSPGMHTSVRARTHMRIYNYPDV